MVPADQGQMVAVQLVVDLGLDPGRLLRTHLPLVQQAGEGVGDRQVVGVDVPLT